MHWHQRMSIVSFCLLLTPLACEGILWKKGSSKRKICIGTNGRMSVPLNRDQHYKNLRDRYTNCTYVDGNLELTWLKDQDMDLSFLSEIREVTGYVLISHVDAPKVVLKSLQIIRGRSLFKISVRNESFALMVTLSKMETLELPALRDILQGSAGFYNNFNLCYMRTLDFDEILTGDNASSIIVYNFDEPERECPKCDDDCKAGCWGPGKENCQQFSKKHCSPQCHKGRCYGSNPRECCHLFCAGGCTGPTMADCFACKNFYDSGVCKQECPPMRRYNPKTYSLEFNPDGKYAYGATCVKNCPNHLLRDSGACVRTCPANKKTENQECVPCDGPCPKKCEGVEVLNVNNIDRFKGCTIIEGSITILDTSFKGYQEVYANFTFGTHHDKMSPSRLSVFSTLKEVTGYLSIQASHPDFKNLSYFENLEIIGGRQLTEYFASLYIVKTSLESLNLRSLKSVNSGSIAILENDHLCFASNIKFEKLLKSSSHSILLQSNANNTVCEAKNLTCHAECSNEGCWGNLANECLSCKAYKLDNTCVNECDTINGIYDAGQKTCKRCHQECEGKCFGPGNGNCSKCRNVRDGPYCVSHCPISKYNDSGECKPCHANCVGGCKGPDNNLGPTGCKSCAKAVVNNVNPNIVEYCLKAEESCPDSYYLEFIGPEGEGMLRYVAGKFVCRKCHAKCSNCTAFGIHKSVCRCRYYESGENCESKCPRDYYADKKQKKCFKCAEECRSCRGPTTLDCEACRNFRVYVSNNETVFNCTATCPPEAPFKVYEADPYCSSVDANAVALHRPDEGSFILIGTSVTVVFLFIIIGGVGYKWRKMKTKANTVKMTMRMTGFDDNEPLKPSNVKPNLAKLRIVKEAELRKGAVLGFGAFGTVYKGVWIPDGENVKIPVAIKVLREGSSPSKDFLEEAYIMASVNHPNLLKLAAVCLASESMLVTQLMPLGSLLDYVRNNKSKIGSKHLLNWSAQIARGMNALEEHRIVHRDLALRNVLLQTPGCIKITDFGLAKFLEIDEETFKSEGGRMPIKWLALESIQQRIFTAKSDVWSFGVTVWELLSYGARPYETIAARNVPEMLEKGERLPQPSIATIDVYLILIKCWMLDAESRPNFKELAEEFSKMARDPGRYLVIPGDKLMRLPSYTPKEHDKELFGQGDEYLNPGNHQNEAEVDPLTPAKKMECAEENSNESPGELFKFRYPVSAYPEGPIDDRRHKMCTQKDSTTSLRYCSDPLEKGNELFMHKTPDFGHKDVALEIPVDDSDYLLPSPCECRNFAGYMDFVSEEKAKNTVPLYPANYAMGTLSHQAVDNMEYHLMRHNTPSTSHGLPEMHLRQVPTPDDDTSDEHEYYNDFDNRLRRELQPLNHTHHTNETAV